MESIVQSAYMPFFKLAQANMATLSQFWLSPDVMWAPFAGTQRPLDPSTPGTAGAGGSEAFSRLMKGLLENYSRFYVELAQNGNAAWARATSQASSAATA
jgi:hypothetical protein